MPNFNRAKFPLVPFGHIYATSRGVEGLAL